MLLHLTSNWMKHSLFSHIKSLRCYILELINHFQVFLPSCLIMLFALMIKLTKTFPDSLIFSICFNAFVVLKIRSFFENNNVATKSTFSFYTLSLSGLSIVKMTCPLGALNTSYQLLNHLRCLFELKN